MSTPYSSRWYTPFFSGLFEGKHCEAMGPAIWLYGWILSRAWVAQRDGVISYTHLDAANALGKSERAIHRWFSTLQECGYIEIRARHSYDMDVAVTKWRTVEEWLDSRAAGGGVTFAGRPDKSGLPDDVRQATNGLPDGRQATREDTSQARNGLPHHISIRLSGYSYPSGPDATRQDVPDDLVSLRHLFADLKERLATSTNKPAMLRMIYQLCFGGPEENLPDYGYVGTVARGVGDEGALAESMWQLTAKEQRNDPLAWLLAWHKQRRSEKGRRNGSGGDQPLPTADDWRRRAETKGAIRRAENSDQ